MMGPEIKEQIFIYVWIQLDTILNQDQSFQNCSDFLGFLEILSKAMSEVACTL